MCTQTLMPIKKANSGLTTNSGLSLVEVNSSAVFNACVNPMQSGDCFIQNRWTTTQGIMGKYSQNYHMCLALAGEMARSQTWSEEEVKSLLQMWSVENVLLSVYSQKQIVFKVKIWCCSIFVYILWRWKLCSVSLCHFLVLGAVPPQVKE